MKSPYFAMTPDYTPVVKMMAMQTHFAVETSHTFMQLAMLPWQGVPTPFGMIKAGLSVTSPRMAEDLPEAPETVTDAVEAAAHVAEDAVEAIADRVEAVIEAVEEVEEVEEVEAAEEVEAVEEVEEVVIEHVTEAATVADTVAEPAPDAVAVDAAPVPETAAEETVVEETVAEETVAVDSAADVAAETPAEPFAVKPALLDKANGFADDLTVLNGVGPKLAETLNEAGIYHYSQIAAWTEANVAWVDENVAGVRGRASRNGWAAQAAELAH